MRTLTEVFAPGGSLLPESLRTLVVSPEREVEPGATVRATFAFYNLGGAAATGLGVRFRLPEGLRYQPGSAKVDDLPLEDQLGETSLLSTNGADIGEVPPGVERRISIAFVVAPTIENGATLELQAALASYEIPMVGSNVVRLHAKSMPQLDGPATIAAIEAVREAEPGQEVRVLARVVNAGQSSAHDVVVVLPVPDRTTYIADSARIDGREVLVDERGDPFGFGNAPVAVGTLAPGATLLVEYRARIDSPLDDGTRLYLHCAVAASEVAEFDLARAELIVAAAPHFDNAETGLTVDVEGDVEPGRRVRIALVARNTGTCGATDVLLQLLLPLGFRYASGSRAIDGRAIGESEDPGLFRFERLDAGERVEVTLEGYVVSPAVNGSTLVIGGRVAFAGIARTFERTLVVRSSPRFTAARNRMTMAGPTTVPSGEDAVFDVAVLNDGTTAATGAHLRIAADAGLENLAFSLNGAGSSRVHNGVVDLGVLEPSVVHQLRFTARVAAPIADRAELRLGAVLETAEVPYTALGTVAIVARSRPKFTPGGSRITALSSEPLRPDRYADLAVHVENEGTDVARDVRLQLQLSPEARIQAVDGATRDGSLLIIGDVPAGGRVDANVRIRLERFVARGAIVVIEARLAGAGVLPFALAPVTIATLAEPQFAQGASLRTQPLEAVDAGDPMQYTLAVRNTGDGSAARVTIKTGIPPYTAYVPGSTSVNDVALLDMAGSSVLWSASGLVLEDVNPGVEAIVRYSVIVNTPLPAGTFIDAQAEIGWDGGGRTVVAAPAVRVRSTPAFAIRASGLPFSVAGVAARAESAPMTQRYVAPPPLPPAAPERSAAPAPQQGLPQLPRALPVQPGSRRPERPPERSQAPTDALEATFSSPVAPIVAPAVVAEASPAEPARPVASEPAFVPVAEPVAAEPVPQPLTTLLELSPEVISRTLKLLESAETGTLVTHLIAIRSLVPETLVGADDELAATFETMRDALRGPIDRLYLKMRMGRYALTAKDIEDRASREALRELVDVLSARKPSVIEVEAGTKLARLTGLVDVSLLVHHRLGLENEPLGSAVPWIVFSSLLPQTLAASGTRDGAVGLYRAALIAEFSSLAALPLDEFHRVLSTRGNPELDAHLGAVRGVLRSVLDANASVPTPSGA